MGGRRWVVAGALFVGGVACGGTEGGGRAGRPAEAEATLLEEGAAKARRAGAGALSVVAGGHSAAGDRIGGFVSVAAGSCAAVFLRASPTVGDADLYLFEEDGSVFASDEGEGPGAVLLACPPAGARLYAMARVLRGAGLVGVGALQTEPAAGPRVARALGAPPEEGAPAAEAFPGLEAKVATRRAALGGRWEETRRVALPVTPRATTWFSVVVPARRCVDILVVPGEEVVSLEVTASDLEGREVARAEEAGRERALVLCAPEGAALSLGLRARASQGLAALVLSRSQEGAEVEIAEEARPTRVGIARAGEKAERELEAALGELGYGSPRSRAQGRTRPGVKTFLQLALPAGCSRIDVVAGAPAGSLAAELWDARPARIAAAEGAAAASLFACSKADSTPTLEVESLARPGPFVALVRPEPASPEPWVALPLAASRLLGRLAAAGLPTSAAKPAEALELRENLRRGRPLSLPSGFCAEVLVALDEGGSGVELRLDLRPAGAPGGAGEARYARARRVVSDVVCAGADDLEGRVEVGLAAGEAKALLLVRPFSPGQADLSGAR